MIAFFKKIFLLRMVVILLIYSILTIPINANTSDMTSSPGGQIKVLSIDSGGINGVVSLKILCELEKQLGKPISEVFDYFIGSSAGGIIVSLLNLKDENGIPIYTAKEVDKVYRKYMKIIFDRRWYSFGIFSPIYDREIMDKVFLEGFKDRTLTSTIKPITLLSFSLNTGKPNIWSTYRARKNDDLNYYLRDAVGATASAPIFFAPKTTLKKDGTIMHDIDGGIFDANPLMTGIAELIDINPHLEKDDIFIVSIGPGRMDLDDSKKIKNMLNYGLTGWVISKPNIVDLIIHADAISDAIQGQKLFPNYHRLDPLIPKDLSSVDDTSADTINELSIITSEYANNSDDFKLVVKNLKKHLDAS
jgi:patatin-like phospholipase/acyl hydrolase